MSLWNHNDNSIAVVGIGGKPSDLGLYDKLWDKSKWREYRRKYFRDEPEVWKQILLQHAIPFADKKLGLKNLICENRILWGHSLAGLFAGNILIADFPCRMGHFRVITKD